MGKLLALHNSPPARLPRYITARLPYLEKDDIFFLEGPNYLGNFSAQKEFTAKPNFDFNEFVTFLVRAPPTAIYNWPVSGAGRIPFTPALSLFRI